MLRECSQKVWRFYFERSDDALNGTNIFSACHINIIVLTTKTVLVFSSERSSRFTKHENLNNKSKIIISRWPDKITAPSSLAFQSELCLLKDGILLRIGNLDDSHRNLGSTEDLFTSNIYLEWLGLRISYQNWLTDWCGCQECWDVVSG